MCPASCRQPRSTKRCAHTWGESAARARCRWSLTAWSVVQAALLLWSVATVSVGVRTAAHPATGLARCRIEGALMRASTFVNARVGSLFSAMQSARRRWPRCGCAGPVTGWDRLAPQRNATSRASAAMARGLAFARRMLKIETGVASSIGSADALQRPIPFPGAAPCPSCCRIRPTPRMR